MSFGLIVLMSLFRDTSAEVTLKLAGVARVDDFILSNVEVAIIIFSDVALGLTVCFTWIDDLKVSIVVSSYGALSLTVSFGSEFATIERITNIQIPIMMKAMKNINRPIKIHFWDAMLLFECQLIRLYYILHNMSIDFEFIRARKSSIITCNLCTHIENM